MVVDLNTIDLNFVQKQMHERLKPSGWGDKLKTFILSEDFYNILETLLAQAKEGKRFTPTLKQVFRAFEECPYDELKAIIIGQDPYPQQDVADGIAFSCSNKKKEEFSLRMMFDEIERTQNMQQIYGRDPDLARWSNQGILLINSAFTTTMRNTGQHYNIWKPFIVFLLDTLKSNKLNLVYGFLGKKAQEWAEYVNEDDCMLQASHPASAYHNKEEKWDCEDIFNKITDEVEKRYKYKIVW